MNEKKQPERTCIACKIKHAKKDLIRIVKNNNGEISLDFTGKKPGRGAYVCPTLACIEKAVKSKALHRAFQCNVPMEVYEKLKGEYSAEQN